MANPEKSSPEPSVRQPVDSYTIQDLEQLRVLADPLRIRILESFCREELTTKQVAEQLQEKPTRLYHHVDALQKVGLIRLVRTRQNRGTLEKYYRSVARRFEADSTLFDSRTPHQAENQQGLGSMMETVLQRTSEELERLVANGSSVVAEEGLLSFIELQISRKRMLRLRDDIQRLLQEIADEESDTGAQEKEARYRLTLALFPLLED